MELFLLLGLSAIIFLFFIWGLEIPALLVRIYREHDSSEQIFKSAKLFIFSLVHFIFIIGTLFILGAIMTIIIVGLIILIPASLVILPILLLGYRWFQLGEMMLQISEVIYNGFRSRME